MSAIKDQSTGILRHYGSPEDVVFAERNTLYIDLSTGLSYVKTTGRDTAGGWQEEEGGEGGGSNLTHAAILALSGATSTETTLTANTSGVITLATGGSGSTHTLPLPTGATDDIIERRLEIASGSLRAVVFKDASNNTIESYTATGAASAGFFQLKKTASGWVRAGSNTVPKPDASQAEAEAGTATNVAMTPQRSYQQIIAKSADLVSTAARDGVTNAQAVLQAELDLLVAAGGGVLRLRQGTYLLNSGIRVPSRAMITIVGEGRGTIIKTSGSFTAGHVIRVDRDDPQPTTWPNALWCDIRDLTFDAAAARTSGAAIYTRRTHDAQIRNVVIGTVPARNSNAPLYWDGIVMDEQDQCVIELCEIGAINDGCVVTGFLTAGEASPPGPFTMNGMLRTVYCRGGHDYGEVDSQGRAFFFNGVGGVHCYDLIAENCYKGFVIDNTREFDAERCSADGCQNWGWEIVQADRVRLSNPWASGCGDQSGSGTGGMLVTNVGTIMIGGLLADGNPNGSGLKVVTADKVVLYNSTVGAVFEGTPSADPVIDIGAGVDVLVATGNEAGGSVTIAAASFTDNGTNIGFPGGGGGQPEITRFTGFNPDALAAGGYFLLHVSGATHTFWYQKDSSGSAPGGQPNPHLVGDIVSASGAWADSTSYNSGDVVTHSSTTYRCTATHTSDAANDEPGAGSSWQSYWEDYGAVMRDLTKTSIDTELAAETNTTLVSGVLQVTDTANGARTDATASSSPASGITISTFQQGS